MVLRCRGWRIGPIGAARQCTRPRSTRAVRTAVLQAEHRAPPILDSGAIASRTSIRTLASSSRTSSRPNDTIYALATGAGRAGVAIIRISGAAVAHIYHSLCLTSRLQPYVRLPPAHKLVVRNVHHPHTRELLDAGAGVILFPAGASYTGETSLELHIHGGVATVSDVLDALGSIRTEARVRPAEAGEFTRRAFEHGRLDLARAEALHALVQAETSMQRRVAVQGTAGFQAKRYEAMRAQLLQAMAMTEALIDFSDEDGVEDGTWMAAVGSVEQMAQLLRGELGVDSAQAWRGATGTRHVGEIVSDGVRLAIYGPPNAGKSSLLNRLADRDAAIVSDVPGTTRDVLQVHLDLGGYKVIVYDTAGLRTRACDEIERIGIARARDAVQSADLSLLVIPADSTSNPPLLRPHSYTAHDADLVFINKTDLHPECARVSGARTWTGSVKTGAGLAELMADLAQLIQTKYAVSTTEAPLITQTRHRFLLLECLDHINRFLDLATTCDPDLVLAAEELRYAAKSLGKITGNHLSADEILGSIFSTFCIGK